MNKQQTVLSIVRFILTAVGAYVAGKYFLGTPIDDNLWLGIAGSVVSVISIVWGIGDKTATLEMLQSSIRSVIVFFGSLLVGTGVIKDEVLQSLLGIVSVLLPMIYSEISKKKSKDIAEGKLGLADLSGVTVGETSIQPVVNTPKETPKP